MQFTGILRTWNNDRGFGFIAPTHGGPELFVHISAFPSDGSRPVEGESVTYELGRGRNAKPQAVRVLRRAIGNVRTRRKATSEKSGSGRSLGLVACAVLAAVCAAYGYARLGKPARPIAVESAMETGESKLPRISPYRCDGRTHCSQMTSCAEATYFLKNCPDVKMDGNHDGIPCERQWCN